MIIGQFLSPYHKFFKNINSFNLYNSCKRQVISLSSFYFSEDEIDTEELSNSQALTSYLLKESEFNCRPSDARADTYDRSLMWLA